MIELDPKKKRRRKKKKKKTEKKTKMEWKTRMKTAPQNNLTITVRNSKEGPEREDSSCPAPLVLFPALKPNLGALPGALHAFCHKI